MDAKIHTCRDTLAMAFAGIGRICSPFCQSQPITRLPCLMDCSSCMAARGWDRPQGIPLECK